MIDNVWHTIHLSSLHGNYLYGRVLDHYEELESVMLVDKKTHQVWLRYFGTHAQILKEMQEKEQKWRHLE